MGCWHGYLSGATCRLVYGPADATATHCLLLQKNPDRFTFLALAHPGSPGKRAVKRVCVCVCALRNCYGLKLPKCWLQNKKKNFTVSLIIIFRTVSLPTSYISWKKSVWGTKDTTKRLLLVGWKQQLRTSADVGFGITRAQVALVTFHSRHVPSSEHDSRLSFSNDQTKSIQKTRQSSIHRMKWRHTIYDGHDTVAILSVLHSTMCGIKARRFIPLFK